MQYKRQSPSSCFPLEIKMGKERNKTTGDENGAAPSKHDHRKSPSKQGIESEPDPDSDSDEESRKSESSRNRTKSKKTKTRTSSSKRRRSRDSDSYSSSSDYDSESDYSEGSYTDSGLDSEEERRRRRKERKRREEKKERRRREKEKEKKRKRREEGKKTKDKKKKDKKKEKEKDKGKKGAVTNSWGKYGIIKETDMWNKRPEFTAWLAEVKQVNLESLPNWEEKQLFKDFMEDHNTATFPSKKYYDLDAYYHSKMEKEKRKGFSKVLETERTVFNDEEQRRQELLLERERHKEEQVEALKRSMQSGMAQAMKEQAQLREEMAYQYKVGNFEAAAAIQRRLDPDVAM